MAHRHEPHDHTWLAWVLVGVACGVFSAYMLFLAHEQDIRTQALMDQTVMLRDALTQDRTLQGVRHHAIMTAENKITNAVLRKERMTAELLRIAGKTNDEIEAIATDTSHDPPAEPESNSEPD